MSTRVRRTFTEEFKAKTVELVRTSGKRRAEISRDLGIAQSLLARWVQQAEIDEGRGPAGALTTEERHELSNLRKEVRELRLEREILKKAAAFFAKESK